MWGRGCIWIKKEQNPKDLKKSGYWGYFMTQTCWTFPTRGGPGCISPRILPSSVLSSNGLLRDWWERFPDYAGPLGPHVQCTKCHGSM